MRQSPNSILREGITSQWSSYGPFWAIAILLWCGNSVVLLGVAPGLTEFYPALVANLSAALALAVTIWLWGRILSAVTHHSLVTLWIVLMAGACVGFVKGVVTFSIFWSITGIPFTVSMLLGQAIAPVIIGMWLLPTFGVIGAVRQRYTQEREVLISERVSTQLHSRSLSLGDKDLDSLISKVHSDVVDATTPTQLQETLHSLAQFEVRRASHAMWEIEDSTVRNFSLAQLSWNTIRNHYFPSVLISVTLFFSLVSFHLPQVPPGEALARSAFQAVVTFVIFTVGKAVSLRGKISGPLVFFLTPLVAVLSIDTATVLFFGSLPQSHRVVSGIILYGSLTSAALIFGVVFAARHAHHVIREELDTLNSRDISLEAQRALQQIRRRETAELLHGYVQNQLMVSALRVKENPGDADMVREELFDLLDKLEAGTLDIQPNDPYLDAFSERVIELWRGVIDVSLKIESTSELTQREQDLVERIVHELISNAHRHGTARSIAIDISITEVNIYFSAEDNGVGPQQGKPGLGSTILSAATTGQWHMSANAVGTHVRGTITRVHG